MNERVNPHPGQGTPVIRRNVHVTGSGTLKIGTTTVWPSGLSDFLLRRVSDRSGLVDGVATGVRWPTPCSRIVSERAAAITQHESNRKATCINSVARDVVARGAEDVAGSPASEPTWGGLSPGFAVRSRGCLSIAPRGMPPESSPFGPVGITSTGIFGSSGLTKYVRLSCLDQSVPDYGSGASCCCSALAFLNRANCSKICGEWGSIAAAFD